MAVIARRTLDGRAYQHHDRRIVIKFKPDIALQYVSEAFAGSGALGELAWRNVRGLVPSAQLLPYFSTVKEAPLTSFVRRTAQNGLGVFDRYFKLECPPGVDLSSVVRTLNIFPEIEVAYSESGPVPPPVSATDDGRSSQQGYLNEAPNGIDARWAWTEEKLDGSGVGFVDLEQGWTLKHEDLVGAEISLISGLNQSYFGHGTAVLGQIAAVDNSIGCVGIAPKVRARVVSQFRTASDYGTAEAILSAASQMELGDVLLLEAQAYYGGSLRFHPVEVEDVVLTAIQHAVGMGIVVVEAGANGGLDLDAFRDEAGRQVLNRSSPDFKDSGAIVVGAASATPPFVRLSFSNYGSRVDCFGWGENITTLGDGGEGNGTTTYVANFGGTSGASPIVAGAAILAQQKAKRDHGTALSPQKMRELLSHRDFNTSSERPMDDLIGVMPNLRGIISQLDA